MNGGWMKWLSAVVFGAALLAGAPVGAQADGERTLFFRTWSDASGQFSIDAAALSFDGKIVQLKKKSDGKTLAVPASRLSAADRAYLARHRQTLRPSEPSTPEPDPKAKPDSLSTTPDDKPQNEEEPPTGDYPRVTTKALLAEVKASRDEAKKKWDGKVIEVRGMVQNLTISEGSVREFYPVIMLRDVPSDPRDLRFTTFQLVACDAKGRKWNPWKKLARHKVAIMRGKVAISSFGAGVRLDDAEIVHSDGATPEISAEQLGADILKNPQLAKERYHLQHFTVTGKVARRVPKDKEELVSGSIVHLVLQGPEGLEVALSHPPGNEGHFEEAKVGSTITVYGRCFIDPDEKESHPVGMEDCHNLGLIIPQGDDERPAATEEEPSPEESEEGEPSKPDVGENSGKLDATQWGVMCWNGRRWASHSLSKMEARIHQQALYVRNTTGIHNHAVLFFSAGLLEGDFRITAEVTGPIRYIGLRDADGKDANIFMSHGGDKRWHSFAMQRKGGELTMSWDGSPVKPVYFQAEADLVSRFGLAMERGNVCGIRKFVYESD